MAITQTIGGALALASFPGGARGAATISGRHAMPTTGSNGQFRSTDQGTTGLILFRLSVGVQHDSWQCAGGTLTGVSLCAASARQRA